MESTSEQKHRLADTTYRVSLKLWIVKKYIINIKTCLLFQNIEELVGDLKSLSAAAKSYQKAMEGEF